ncbi:MAG TPA: DUF885 domain-containing protein [Caldimonas sp.]
MRRIARPLIALALAALPLAAPAQTSVRERLTALAERLVATTLTEDPIAASSLGLSAADSRLEIPSEAARAARIARLNGWKHELEAIAQGAGGGLGLVDGNNVRLLRAEFDSELNELVDRQSDRKSYARPALRLVQAIFSQFLHLPIVGREGAVPADLDKAWDDLAARLEQGPAFIVAGQKLVTQPGQLQGTVGAQQLAGVPDFLRGTLSEAASAQMVGRPAALARFVAARDAVLATIAETRGLLDAQAASWPVNHVIGKAAYERMLREELLLPFDAAEIEHMARDELAHGWAEEAWLTALSRKRGLPFGPDSGGGLAPGGPPLVGYYRDRIAELTVFMKEHEVVTVPEWLGSMQIVETPAFLRPVSPGAAMYSPRLFSKSSTGYYFITPPRSLEEAAKRLDMNEDFDRDRIWSTAAHEAMPGHFMQLSIARRHPDLIRRLQRDAAFAEGWAFYGEEMLVRLGLYGDGLDARLFTARWERVRGARAIVDPKLASGEWSVEQAVDFYEKHSGFTRGAAQAAVNGIALGPGYVIAYTVGRLQLQMLLGEYMLRTGERGSLRDFHDRLLSYGSTPFAVVGPELLADLDKPAAAVRAAANY